MSDLFNLPVNCCY